MKWWILSLMFGYSDCYMCSWIPFSKNQPLPTCSSGFVFLHCLKYMLQALWEWEKTDFWGEEENICPKNLYPINMNSISSSNLAKDRSNSQMFPVWGKKVWNYLKNKLWFFFLWFPTQLKTGGSFVSPRVNNKSCGAFKVSDLFTYSSECTFCNTLMMH